MKEFSTQYISSKAKKVSSQLHLHQSKKNYDLTFPNKVPTKVWHDKFFYTKHLVTVAR